VFYPKKRRIDETDRLGKRDIQSDKDRQLDDHRHAAAARIDLVLTIKLHHFFVEFFRVFLVLVAQTRHLRLDELHALHGHVADTREREEHEIDECRQNDDRNAVVPEYFLQKFQTAHKDLADGVKFPEVDQLFHP